MPGDFTYGGQAVIEGVMMRGQRRMAVALRKPDGRVLVVEREYIPWSDMWKIFKLPFFRGISALGESLSLGITALMISANEAAESEDEKLSSGQMAFSLALAVVVVLGLFVVGPTALLGRLKAAGGGIMALNLAEGLARIGVLVAYVLVISRVKDIQRVLQYHGAEHKVIHAYEAGEELTPDNASRYPVLHPRCGTSFLLFVAVVSIVLYSFFGWPGVVQRILLRLLMLPLVVGISYEIIKRSARANSRITRLAIAPGLWLQRLATREPDISQLEVAIESFRAASRPDSGEGKASA